MNMFLEFNKEGFDPLAAFMSEAVELARVCGYSQSDVQRQVEQAFSRPVGDFEPIVGGVSLALLLLCTPRNTNPKKALDKEMQRAVDHLERLEAERTP
jgi:hypothetical protein